MASQFSSCWMCLWIIVISRKLSADSAHSPPHYTIHPTKVSFDQATQDCLPGVLTTLTTKQEVAKILRLISKSMLPHNEFRFWVGLKKEKNECVIPTLPLRGFKWIEDGSEESQVSRWEKEPQETCTTVHCAVLQGALNDSAVTRWGLTPITCKNTYQFICKQRNTKTSGDRKTTIKPVALEPVTPELKLAAPDSPKPAIPEPKLATQGPEPETDLKPKTELELQGPDPGPVSGPALGSDLCQHPLIPRARSLRPDPDNSSVIQVECWSTDPLELHCRGRPPVWHLLDNSPANFTTICQPCSNGFGKDTSGNCVDIDECSGSAPCRHTCLNTEGSYRCVCTDKHGKHLNESSPACTDTVTTDDGSSLSGIPIPVLVTVLVLLVLVLVVAVTVKCCLMKRSKKRSMKKSEKMAMKNKDQDSFTTTSENAAT